MNEIGFHDTLNHQNRLLYVLGAFLNNPQDLAALSLTCKECCFCLQSLLTSFRDKTWHSSHVRLLPQVSSQDEESTFQAECVTGVPNEWTSRKHTAQMEFFDQEGVEVRPIAAFHSGNHYESFNSLHGYCSLANLPLIPNRWHGGVGYPYVGKSKTSFFTHASDLCVHPAETGECTIVTFVCPLPGIYNISSVKVNFFDDRASGIVELFIHAPLKILVSSSGRKMLVKRENNRDSLYLQANPTNGSSFSTTSEISRRLEKGDRIAFSVRTTDFSYAALRLEWCIRCGEIPDC